MTRTKNLNARQTCGRVSVPAHIPFALTGQAYADGFLLSASRTPPQHYAWPTQTSGTRELTLLGEAHNQ